MDVGGKVRKLIFFTWALLPLFSGEGWAQLDVPAGDVDLIEDDCECLPFFQCNNTYGAGAIELKLKTCERVGDVCCPFEIEPTPAVTTPSEPTPTVPTPSVPTPAVSIPVGAKQKPVSHIILNECGIRNIDGIGYKISLGEDTMLGEFPWMVAIMSEKDGEEKFECGGSIIHHQVVLTAAHCIDRLDKGNLIARGGAWDFRSNKQIRPQQNRKVQKIIIHKDYEREAALYDIALLILEEPYTEAENLGIICLPTQENVVYEDCIVTGWGGSHRDGELQESLKLVELPIVPRDECQALLRKTRLGKRFKLHQTFICAGGVGADSCLGDGGGPLICPIKDGKQMQYHQVGIVSWGIDCGVNPGVYVNVVLFVDWIFEQMYTGDTDENRKTVYSVITEPEFNTSSSEEIGCECVPFFQCNNEYGRKIIQLRFAEVECDVVGQVCCDISSEEDLNEHTVGVNEECGIRNLGNIGYRVTGTENEANLGEFPWMVAIMMEGTEGVDYRCGGSLIHPRVVLTAAHCVVRKNVKQMRARAGDVDLFTPSNRPFQDRRVQKIIIHEKFNRGSGYNDIALLILENSYKLSKHVGIICIDQHNTTLNEECVVTGWGKDSEGGKLQQTLRIVELPIVPQDQCQALLKQTDLGQRYKLHESFICAGGPNGTDSCEGDGGSPLICPVKGGKEMQYQQVGVVSWGIAKGCSTNIPGIYASVTLFAEWIKVQINKNLNPR